MRPIPHCPAWSRSASARSRLPSRRICTAPAWPALLPRVSGSPASAPGARLLAVHGVPAGGERGKHDLPDPQGHRLGGAPRRPDHQHELCGPARSLARARAQGRLRQRRRAGRGRRQCRAASSAAVSRRRPERDRGDCYRRRRQAVPRRQPRQTSRSPRPASTSWCRRRRAPTSSRPARRSPRRRSAAWWR